VGRFLVPQLITLFFRMHRNAGGLVGSRMLTFSRSRVLPERNPLHFFVQLAFGSSKGHNLKELRENRQP